MDVEREGRAEAPGDPVPAVDRAGGRAVRVAWVAWLLLVLVGWSADAARASSARASGARATAATAVEVEVARPVAPDGLVTTQAGPGHPDRVEGAGLDPAPRSAVLAVHFRAAGRDSCSGTALPPPYLR
jgi:hypothetical protein